jgi:hypothetical protein
VRCIRLGANKSTVPVACGLRHRTHVLRGYLEKEGSFTRVRVAAPLVDNNEESVRSAAKELVSAGHQALAIRCDVANEHQVAAMVEQTVSKF